MKQHEVIVKTKPAPVVYVKWNADTRKYERTVPNFALGIMAYDDLIKMYWCESIQGYVTVPENEHE